MVTRRQLLQLGTIAPLGLTLPKLMAEGNSERSCIFIVQYGGASHIDSLDPKPGAPEEIRGPYQPIATRTPGMFLSDRLPKLAELSEQFQLIRSMTHGNGGHDGGMHIAMTGHSNPRPETPYLGSVVSKLRPATVNIPSYVWLQNLAGDVEPRYLNGGFLGASHAPLRVGTDENTPSSPSFRFSAFDPPEGVSLLSRQELLKSLDAHASQDALGSRAFSKFQEQAVELVTGERARLAFDLSQERPEVRAQYGMHPLGQNLLMARRLVEAGVRLVSVTAWCGLAEGEKFTNVQTWDMHGPVAAHIGSIFGNGSYGLGFALPRVDQSVSALLTDLEERGLLESTFVVMVGEFGRSPRVVNTGRDHWPACYSALLAGGGTSGGKVYGASDAQGAYVHEAPVTPEDFAATLLHAMGIDPKSRLSPDGFTMPASIGNPIEELF